MARYNIAQLRKDEGMTQQELASRLKISQGFLSSIETAKNNFPADKVEILKQIFPTADLESYLIDDDIVKTGYELGNNNSDSQIHINDPEALKTLLSMVTSINTDGKNQLEVFTSEITTLRKRIDDLHDRNERLLDKIESLTQALGEQYKKNNALIALLAEQGIKPPVSTLIQ